MSAAVETLPFSRRFKDMDRSRKPKACRNLFGRPDKEELDRLLRAELQSCKNADCNKYNFDFDRDTPLDGKYEWDRVDSLDIPEFYTPVTVINGKRFPQRTPGVASEGCRPVQQQSATQTISDTSALPLGLQARLGLDTQESLRTDPVEDSEANQSSCATVKSIAKPIQKAAKSCASTASSTKQQKITGRCAYHFNSFLCFKKFSSMKK